MLKAMWKVYKEYEPELKQMLKELEHTKKLLVFENRKELNKFLKKIELTGDINKINV